MQRIMFSSVCCSYSTRDILDPKKKLPFIQRIICITLLLLLFGSSVSAKKFKRFPYSGLSGASAVFTTKASLMYCFSFCTNEKRCNSLEWLSEENTCRLYEMGENHGSFVSSANTEFYIAMNPPCGWYLVFHATAGISQSVANLWKSQSGTNLTSWDGNPSNPATQATSHYKSGLVDVWKSLNPSQAKFVLYRNGDEVVHLVFNVFGSDKMNWFSYNRFQSGSYTDITDKMRSTKCTGLGCRFSIMGHPDDTGGPHRRFLVSWYYKDCPSDVGWMMVIDNSYDICEWAQSNNNEWPVFMYSTSGAADLFSKSAVMKKADTLAVFLKL